MVKLFYDKLKIKMLYLILSKWCNYSGAGYITTSVLKQILHEIDDTLNDTDLNGMIEEIDEDGSGTVDVFTEFMEMMTG